jgi:hypothetical protein
MVPLIEPDFSEVLDQLPEGTYKAHVVDSDVKDSQAGNKYIRWQLSIFDAADQRCNGKAIWYNTPVSGKGAFRLKALYAAAMGQKLEGSFDTTELMGKAVVITVINGHDKEGNATGFSEVKALKALAN